VKYFAAITANVLKYLNKKKHFVSFQENVDVPGCIDRKKRMAIAVKHDDQER
jgi:hypothetical protein